MINIDNVLFYIKGHLSLPSTYIEEADKDIKEWIKNTAHREFSQYIPDKGYTAVLPNNELFKHPEKKQWYYFFDDEELPIVTIRECIFQSSNVFSTGHPIVGPLGLQEMKNWALHVFESRFVYPYSQFSFTYHFIPPNIINVMPEPNDTFAVHYERVQPYDLRNIPTSLEMQYMDLCLAHYMIKLGRMRSHYSGRIQTPYGEIPLEAEALKSDGENIRREVIEQLKEASIPPIIINIS